MDQIVMVPQLLRWNRVDKLNFRYATCGASFVSYGDSA